MFCFVQPKTPHHMTLAQKEIRADNAATQRLNLMVAQAMHGKALYRHLVRMNDGNGKGVQSGLNQLVTKQVKREIVRAPGILLPKQTFEVFAYSGK